MKHAARKGAALLFDRRYDQYVYSGLPVHTIDVHTEFTIHNPKDIHKELPFQ